MRESVRQTVKAIVESVVEPELVEGMLSKPATPQDFDCLEAVVERFSSSCFHIGKVCIIVSGDMQVQCKLWQYCRVSAIDELTVLWCDWCTGGLCSASCVCTG